MTVLLVGGTGKLGGAVAKELSEQALPFRCLVRKTSDTTQLRELNCELIPGDVRDRSSLQTAMEGVDTVISSFTTRLPTKQLSDFWDVDYGGNLSLLELSRTNRVKKYVFVSYWGLAKFSNFEHGKVKRMVEDLLRVSGLDYTVFRVTTLATDLVDLMGNSLKRRGWGPMLFRKDEKVRPILVQDLAKCMVDSLNNPKASGKIIEIAGEDEYTFEELRELYCKALRRKVRFLYVPLPLAKFIAATVDYVTGDRYNARGLVSAFTGGSTCDITEAKSVFDIPFGSFTDYLMDYFK
jgi:NADH dehydrogenase